MIIAAPLIMIAFESDRDQSGKRLAVTLSRFVSSLRCSGIWKGESAVLDIE
jgi:hypothetical protein